MACGEFRRHARAGAVRGCGSTGADRPSRRSRRAARCARRRSLAVALDVVEGEAQDRGELVDEGRLEGGEPVLGEADEGRGDRLVRAALGRERDAGGRRDEDEASVLVAGVIQGIEPAGDERIVERADRQQPVAEKGMREAEGGEQDEQVHLGDAELDMLALRRKIPVERRGDALGLENVLHLLPRKKAAPVDQAAEIGRDGHVRRGRDDARGERLVGAREFVEDEAEALLRRHRGLFRRWQRVGNRRSPAARSGAGPSRRRAPISGSARSPPAAASGPRNGPIRGRGGRPWRRDTPPSGPASGGRNGCPCARRAAGRSP